MSKYWSVAVHNLGVMLMVAFALYLTHSLWSFLGIFFLVTLKDNIAKCPDCGKEFKIEDDDE